MTESGFVSKYNYDAVLFVSFGGPEGRDDVIPFLENVLRGRNVPRERMLEVAEHYYHFDGMSPINQQTRELMAAVKADLKELGVEIPIYWGNRNWNPLLPDTMQKMKDDGIQNAIAFVVSAYSSYSGCRQYRENILAAQDAVGENSPKVDKIRTFYNHPDFIAANVEHIQAAINSLPESQQSEFRLALTAHSIPESMASTSDYVQQLSETCRLITEELNLPPKRWRLVYQSRSGRPEDPWLEPDILDHIDELDSQGVKSLVISPVGFLSDHMEVLFDLDEEAAQKCEELDITLVRADSPGNHPKFVRCVSKLIIERLDKSVEKEAIGKFPANWDVCAKDCCPAPVRPTKRPAG
ncbi:ferrochelatase [Thalassoglobus sp.]|uniref:ferrochelatase n=1 Tax=Thalassoglobus sp. TaxID=2795869 RepID=UPI003AA95EBD